MRLLRLFSFVICFFIMLPALSSYSEEVPVHEQRLTLYKKVEAITHIPWYYLAAVDQYERNIRSVRKDLPKAKGITGIHFTEQEWVGMLNPDPSDQNLASIKFFNGIGYDGNGDGLANHDDDEDIIHAFAQYLLGYGVDHDNIKIGLWDYYKRDKTVGIIIGKAKIYQHFGRIDLNDHVFPLPLRSRYSYRNNWGVARGWGGRRAHEGTDIFADYGVPVRATTYGIVEMKGWNRYGGWRIGIRDTNNNYHYFAHLSGFSKDLKLGQIVEPGTVIGGVGSSGYGPPGTSGKFPPHLHYGIYKDNGYTEWSYDPYPLLKLWERQEKKKR